MSQRAEIVGQKFGLLTVLTDESWEYDPTAGTCKHECSHRDGVVWITNDNDLHYTESFKTREELEEFIAKLRACADECWPH